MLTAFYDARSDRLVVHDGEADRLAAACRLTTPRDALRHGGNRAAKAFDLALLIVLRERMLEIDHLEIDWRYRVDAVIAPLFASIARYLIEHRFDHLLATVEVSTRDGGHVAASLYRRAWAGSMSPEDYRVFPHRRLPIERLSDTRAIAAPPVLGSFLERGAWLCGEPAHDPWRESAAFPLLLPLARMQDRYARRFLRDAA